jgi:hypothetical protein
MDAKVRENETLIFDERMIFVDEHHVFCDQNMLFFDEIVLILVCCKIYLGEKINNFKG